MDINANQNGGASDSGGESEPAHLDSALSKRAISVREKLQDDTYSWIMQCLEMTFEFFNEKGPRDEEIKKLSDVALKFCIQQLEHKRSKDVFEGLCHMYPVKSCPRDFDFTKEYNKLIAKEAKVKKEDAKRHPKFIKFLERVKELERGKELSQTEAISVD